MGITPPPPLPPLQSASLEMDTLTSRPTRRSSHMESNVAAPPPSEYSSDYAFRPGFLDPIQSRSLPPPPAFNPYETHPPDRSDSRYYHHDDNASDETPPKLVNSYDSSQTRDLSSSVYISMSAIPSLHEEGREREGGGGGEEGKGKVGRSESLYSNSEVLQREVSGNKSGSHHSAVSHDSHVTMGNLKTWMEG